jgi:hypothetical protein
MTQHSRRTFLITTGVAATTAGAVASGALPAAAAAPAGRDHAPDHAPDHAGSGAADRRSVVAYVSDAASGQVTVMSGDREVVVTDHALVRRLTREVG